MYAHAWDLRAELPEDEHALADAVLVGWQDAKLSEVDRALCAFAEKLTRTPAAMAEADVVALRERGLDDLAIHDAIQVVSYFNYINRVADALNVDPESWMDPPAEVWLATKARDYRADAQP